MSETARDIILARYNLSERESDALGRMILVKKLTQSQMVRLNEMTPLLEGETVITGNDGKSFSLSHRSPMLIAASVRAIDDAPIPFPKSRAELDATLDALAEEGLTAGIVAYGRLLQAGGVPPEKVVETAKN